MTYPAVSLPNQWTNGEELNATKMNARIDANFNAIIAASPVYFFGSLLTSTAVSTLVNINLTTIVADTATGWDSTNHRYVFKVAGLYLVNGAVKCNSTATALGLGFIKNGAVFAYAPNSASAAFAGAAGSFVAQFAVNDTIAIAPSTTYTSQSDSPAHNNFMTITQINYI